MHKIKAEVKYQGMEKLIRYILQISGKLEKIMTMEKIVEYGIQKFEEGKYDLALEALIRAYMGEYRQKEILKNIYSCYMEGNEREFRTGYEKCCIYADISYEECILDFIPYREGEYYIYDKSEKTFVGKLAVSEMEQVEELIRKFDDVVVELEWDWRNFMAVLKWTDCHKVYVICHDRQRAASFCKVPELAEYFKKVKAFEDLESYQQYFHAHTDVYLPRVFLGSEQEQQKMTQIWKDEHAYRLTPEGRNTENIVLSIGIPTHDRGNLALQRVKNLLEMCYDAEIEIMVSKNGTTLYQEEYQELGELPDARINYVDHNKELTADISWIKTVELSKGRHVLLISDEDDVILEALDHYLAMLSQNPNLVFIRAKSMLQYSFVETKDCRKGIDAFSNVFLMNNYLSGAIVRRDNFMQLPFDRIRKYGKDNAYYISYTHEWWFTLLSFEGDCRLDGECLIAEGDSVRELQGKKYREKGENSLADGYDTECGLHAYATYKERLKQFKGYIEFIHYIEDKGEKELARRGVFLAISKTAYLIKLAYSKKYKQDEIVDVWTEYSELCMEAVNEFSFNNSEKRMLLEVMLGNIKEISW